MDGLALMLDQHNRDWSQQIKTRKQKKMFACKPLDVKKNKSSMWTQKKLWPHTFLPLTQMGQIYKWVLSKATDKNPFFVIQPGHYQYYCSSSSQQAAAHSRCWSSCLNSTGTKRLVKPQVQIVPIEYKRKISSVLRTQEKIKRHRTYGTSVAKVP